MSQLEVTLTWYDESGDEVTHTFPAINEVCHECEGFGSHLNPSIGDYAYSVEEFRESFDEEEQEQYFQRGGIYDVRCSVCQGNKVIPVVDVDNGQLSQEQKKLYAEYEVAEERRAESDAEDRATRRAENGGY